MFTDLTSRERSAVLRIGIAVVILIVTGILTLNNNIELILYILAYLIVGYDVLLTAIYNIKDGEVFDENFLMSIATIGAFFLGEYNEAVFVMLFYKVGEIFESLAVGRSRKSIQGLLDIQPEEATVLRDGIEEILDPEDVEIGEIIIVKPGERIPLDGIVIEGVSSINNAFLTGESIPVDVNVGDEIYSGGINLNGLLKVKVDSAFEDSTVSKILELIENSASKKSVIENFITRFARIYTPAVVGAAAILAIVPPLLFGGVWAVWIKRALIFLVVSCPCALVISAPLSFFGGIGKASKQGILVKGSNYLEKLSMVKTIVMDKTGTLTKGSFDVVDSQTILEDSDWLEKAALLESYSNHPIAKSIVKSVDLSDKFEIHDVEELHGRGMVGYIGNERILVGNSKLMEEYKIPYAEDNSYYSKIYVALDDIHAGTVLLADVIKPNAKEALREMKHSGIEKTILLTGDKSEVAEAVGSELGIDVIHSELLPKDKVDNFEEILKNKGASEMVAFVGDGINDAPVLMRSDVGIAMGALGSDAAIEAADVILMDDNLMKLSEAMNISKFTMKIVRQNITFALGVKFFVLALSVFGLANMWMAVFADVGVTVIAVINSMRTLR